MPASRGFTIIELIVVVATVAVLSAIVLSNVNKFAAKARDTKRIADINQLQKVLEMYYAQNGRYPNSSSCGATSPNSGWCNSVESLSGGHWIRDNGTTNVLGSYVSAEPLDPKQAGTAPFYPNNGGAYFYYSNYTGGYSSNGQWYMIVFGLENYPHPLELQDGTIACDGSPFNYSEYGSGIITVGTKCKK
jgi:prepilin-type N-terminal cleavage/methylation domain-containing protein